ncbi:nitrilase family protein [Salinicola peritrichatus]|uniref:nitrilase family protein n=1 Tax=Salinicola peritrichatus TaxID=1267424 RepID=UPI000DA1E1BB|nr:nitrilase family protein [Salinicola peritrichatus]
MAHASPPLSLSATSEEPDEGKLKVACIQFEPEFGNVALNIQRSLELIEKAADAGSRIVVLPELCNTGYVFQSRAEVFALGEPIPDGTTTQAWSEIAARLDIILVAGIAERDGDRLYNSAVIIDHTGVLGVYRKLHLWSDENLYFEPGNLGVPVFSTLYGRISVAICYDGWFPETFRIAVTQGADIVCVPTNWVPLPESQPGDQPMANILHMAAAHSNSIVIACADRIGVERGQAFLGHSLIINHTGWAVAGPASSDNEEILIGEVDLSAARRDRSLNKFNHLLRDRRMDVYAEFPGLDINS